MPKDSRLHNNHANKSVVCEN